MQREVLQTQQYIGGLVRKRSKGRFITTLVAILGMLVMTITFTLSMTKANAQAAIPCPGGDRTYHVVRNDTLSSIANRYGMSWQTLASHNHIANPDRIYPGQQVCISEQRNLQTASRSTVAFNYAMPEVAGKSAITNTIIQVFGPYASAAVRVATCESGLNPNAQNPSGAAGLFQIKPDTWALTKEAHQSEFNANANIQAAYEIFVRDGYSWREWACKP